MPRKTEPDGKAIARALAKDLPGWQLAGKDPRDAAAAPADVEGRPRGPTIKQLRAKFLGDSADSGDAADGPEDYGSLDTKRTSVKVKPTDGGPAKTADIEDGEAKIVQG